MATDRLETTMYAGLLLLLAACLVVVRPFGDFPLNDDWAYAQSVRTLLAEGRFELSDWTPASSVFHIAWGASWSALFGYSHVVLRCSVFFWLAVGALLLAATLRRLGADRLSSFLAAGCLILNPLALSFGLTFHTDLSFVGLGIAALYCFVRFDEQDDHRWLWGASLLVACAVLTRQIGIVFGLGMAASLAWRRHFAPGIWVALLALPLAALAAYSILFREDFAATWAGAYFIDDARRYLADPSQWVPTSTRRVVGAVACVCLFALPLIATRPLPAGRLAWLAAAAALPLGWHFGSLPWFANALSSAGIGTITLHDVAAKPSGFFGWPSFIAALSVAAWAAAWWVLAGGNLLRAMPDEVAREQSSPDDERRRIATIALIWVGVFLASLPKRIFFDRYLLVLLPAVLVWVAGSIPPASGSAATRRRLLGAAALLALALVTLAGTADYFAWNDAKWRLGRRALASGVAPGDVAGGVDWDAHFTYRQNMRVLKQHKPLREIDRWDWQGMNPRRSILSFSPQVPPWVRVVDDETYWTPLAPGTRVTIYRVERPDSPAGRRER